MRTWLAVAIACVGCGGGSGDDVSAFLGTYQTTQRTSASNPGATVDCTDLGDPVADAAPYFVIEVDPFFGDPSQLTLEECTDATAADCTDAMVPLAKSDAGLEAEEYNTQTGGGFACQLYYTRATATLSGAAVTVMMLTKYAAPDIDSADCTLDMAKALASAPDCETVDVWSGTKL